MILLTLDLLTQMQMVNKPILVGGIFLFYIVLALLLSMASFSYTGIDGIDVETGAGASFSTERETITILGLISFEVSMLLMIH